MYKLVLGMLLAALAGSARAELKTERFAVLCFTVDAVLDADAIIQEAVMASPEQLQTLVLRTGCLVLSGEVHLKQLRFFPFPIYEDSKRKLTVVLSMLRIADGPFPLTPLYTSLRWQGDAPPPELSWPKAE